jgi:hypothetical protein
MAGGPVASVVVVTAAAAVDVAGLAALIGWRRRA